MDIKYKILQGYEHDRNITINEDELERAYGLFMLGGRWIFSGGAVDGKNIQTIVPDWNATMGWNKEYKLGTDDDEEIASKGLDRKSQKTLASAQEKVRYLIATKQENLIGTNAKLPELDTPQRKEISNEVKRIADNKRV
jgi:hypothetical protein